MGENFYSAKIIIVSIKTYVFLAKIFGNHSCGEQLHNYTVSMYCHNLIYHAGWAPAT